MPNDERTALKRGRKYTIAAILSAFNSFLFQSYSLIVLFF